MGLKRGQVCVLLSGFRVCVQFGFLKDLSASVGTTDEGIRTSIVLVSVCTWDLLAVIKI